MVRLHDIVDDRGIAPDRNLEELGVSQDEVLDELVAEARTEDPEALREFFRDCMSRSLAAMFGDPWTVGRLRAALPKDGRQDA